MSQKPDPHPQKVMNILKNRTPETRIAVVGASNNPEKYGHIIVDNLSKKGYTILPINPREETICGLKAYPSLEAAERPIHLINVVTPPNITLKVLEQVAALGLDNVWLQDGSFDDQVLGFVATAPFNTVYDACTMVVSNY